MRTNKNSSNAPPHIPAVERKPLGQLVSAPSSEVPPAGFPGAVLDALIPSLPLRDALRFAAVSKDIKQRTAQVWRPAWKSAMQQAPSNAAARSVVPQLCALAGDRKDDVAQEYVQAALRDASQYGRGQTIAALATDAQMQQAIDAALATLESPEHKQLGIQQLFQLGPRLELAGQAVYRALFEKGTFMLASDHLERVLSILYSIRHRCSDAQYGDAFMMLLRASLACSTDAKPFANVVKLTEHLPADYVSPALCLVMPNLSHRAEQRLNETRWVVMGALLPKLPSEQTLQKLKELRLSIEAAYGSCREGFLPPVVSSLPQKLIDSTLLEEIRSSRGCRRDAFSDHLLMRASSSCLEQLKDYEVKHLLRLWPKTPSSIAMRLSKSRVDHICKQALRQLSFPLGQVNSRRTSLQLLNQLGPHASTQLQQRILARTENLMPVDRRYRNAMEERWGAMDIRSNLFPLHPPQAYDGMVSDFVQKMHRWETYKGFTMNDLHHSVQLLRSVARFLSPDQAWDAWRAEAAFTLRSTTDSKRDPPFVRPMLFDLGSHLGPHHPACWAEALRFTAAEELAVHHLGISLLSFLALSGSPEQMLAAWQAASTVRTKTGTQSSEAADEALDRLLPRLSQATIRAALANARKEINTHYGRKAWEMLMGRADAATAHIGLTHVPNGELGGGISS
jgi:hypothetical protein